MKNSFLRSTISPGIFVLFTAAAAAGVAIVSLNCRSSSEERGGTSISRRTANSEIKQNDAAEEAAGSKKADGGDGVNGRSGNVPTAGESEREKEILPISWSFSPSQYRGKDNQRFTFKCPAKGQPGLVYGTGVYTDDSSVCTAAVHEGLISVDDGGIVTIEIRPGQDAFVGSERNNIKTSDFNNHWNGAFVFAAGRGGS